jgi:hypothetical protein
MLPATRMRPANSVLRTSRYSALSKARFGSSVRHTSGCSIAARSASVSAEIDAGSSCGMPDTFLSRKGSSSSCSPRIELRRVLRGTALHGVRRPPAARRPPLLAAARPRRRFTNQSSASRTNCFGSHRSFCASPSLAAVHARPGPRRRGRHPPSRRHSAPASSQRIPSALVASNKP